MGAVPAALDPAREPPAVPRRFRISLVLVATAAYLTGVLARLAGRGLDPWILHDYLVSYQSHGFVRRGLIGTVVAPWVNSPTSVAVAAAATSVVTAIATVVLLDRLGARLPEAQRRLLLVGAVPLLCQTGWDLGRQDMLLIPLLVAAGMLVREGRPRLVMPLLAGGLVHEHVLAWLMVLLVAGVIMGWTNAEEVLPPVLGTVALGILLALVGGFEGSSSAFAERLPVWAPDADTLVVRSAPWTGSVRDAVGDVGDYLAIGGGVATVLLVVALAVCARALWRRLDPLVAIVAVAPAVALATVAVDHMRWALWSVVVTGLLLAMGRALPVLRRDAVMPSVVLLLVLGPPGHVAPLPYWTSL